MPDANWMAEAVKTIKSGIADRLSRGNVTVYRIGTKMIRIDVKLEEEIK